MKSNPLSRRLASKLHIAQIETLRRAAGTERAIDRTVKTATDRILAAVADTSDPFNIWRQQRLKAAIWPMWQEINDTMEAQFKAMADYGYKQATRTLLRTVPRRWWRVQVPTSPVKEWMEATVDPFFPQFPPIPPVGGVTTSPPPDDPRRRFGPLAVDIEDEPVRKGGISQKEFEELMEEILFPPPSEELVNKWVFSSGWQNRLGNLSKQIANPDRLAGELAFGISGGENIAELTKRVKDATGVASSAAKRIARTEAMRVAGNAQNQSFTALGDLQVGLMHHAQVDANSRPEHAALNGQIYYFPDEGKSPTIDEMVIEPGSDRLPNCVLPNAIVQGRVLCATRASYSGYVYEIKTASGERLTVTPNHPIGTASGFVRAKYLKTSDNLLRYSRNQFWTPPLDHVHDGPTAISEVFESLAMLGASATCPRSVSQFDGDAIFFNSDIDVVTTDSALASCLQSAAVKFLDQFQFHRPNPLRTPSEGLGSSAFLQDIDRDRSAPSGNTAICETTLETLSTPPQRITFVPELRCVGLASQINACLPKLSDKYASANVGFLPQLLKRYPLVVAFDKVTDIWVRYWSGHVYDLETDIGYFFSRNPNLSESSDPSSGLLIGNCRCWHSPVLREPEEVRDDPAVRADFENASGDEIPDPSAYDQWFQQADEPTRMQAVGRRKYQTAKEVLGREPDWLDFVDTDGARLPLDKIKSEADDQRFQRRSEVYAMLRQRQQQFIQVSSQGFVFSR